MADFNSVCVYCGSSNRVDPRFLDTADRFGKAVAARGLRMVYGGGNVGLMGASARAAHDNGAEVVGVIPRFLTHIEQPHPSIRTEVVETIFGLPGVGRYFVEGALNRDYTLVLGMVVFYAALVVLANLVADLLQGWADPRVRGVHR